MLTPSNVKVVSPRCHFFYGQQKRTLFKISLFLIKLINKPAGFLRTAVAAHRGGLLRASFAGFEECRRTPVRLCHRYSLRGSGMRAEIKVTSVAAQQHVQRRRCRRSLHLPACSTVALPKKTQNASYALLRSVEEWCSRPLAKLKTAKTH